MIGNLKFSAFQRRRNLVAAVASELIERPMRCLALQASRRSPSPPSAWRKGVLLGANHIGDTLLLTPSLPFLRQGLPQCEWFLAVDSLSAEVMRGNPNLAGTIRMPGAAAGFAERRAWLSQFGFDAAFCYNSVAYWPDLVLSVAAGIPSRAAYVHKGFSGLVTHPLSIRMPRPYAGHFQDGVSELTGLAPTWPLQPRLYPSDEDNAAAEEAWTAVIGRVEPSVVACFVTTRQRAASWPLDRFAEAIRLVAARAGVRVVLCGSADDAAALAQVNERSGLRSPILAGRLGLRACFCFLKRCSLVLAPDSGPRHLANAAGVPVVFIRNPCAGRVATGTYCEQEFDAGGDGEFLLSRREQEAYFDRITPEYVAGEVTRRLAATRSAY